MTQGEVTFGRPLPWSPPIVQLLAVAGVPTWQGLTQGHCSRALRCESTRIAGGHHAHMTIREGSRWQEEKTYTMEEQGQGG